MPRCARARADGSPLYTPDAPTGLAQDTASGTLRADSLTLRYASGAARPGP
jgi:hypothetical protein